LFNRLFTEKKYGYASYHPGLNQFRASSWAKLPPLWYLAAEYGDHYEYIWFMDSDAGTICFFILLTALLILQMNLCMLSVLISAESVV
jgi:hypothetical protein